MASSETPSTVKPDYRNADLVSRLLAATPPYLYNMPLVPNSFFFSEMLRSFVQAKTNNPTLPHSGNRRGRKRSWRESKLQPPNDKPLELTTTSKPTTPPPKPSSPQLQPPPPPLAFPPCNLLPVPSPSESMLPPAPLWYPPLYPPNLPPQPYNFDPLHFFIDLRVSGHIWDRKPEKDLPSPSGEPLNLQTEDKKNKLRIGSPFRQTKHNSAFSVPQPRENYEDHFLNRKSPTGTNYVLQNLPRIYQDVKTSQEKQDNKPDEELTPEEKKCKDLRALIGLELVVDYVKHEDRPGQKIEEEESQKSPESVEVGMDN